MKKIVYVIVSTTDIDLKRGSAKAMVMTFKVNKGNPSFYWRDAKEIFGKYQGVIKLDDVINDEVLTFDSRYLCDKAIANYGKENKVSYGIEVEE